MNSKELRHLVLEEVEQRITQKRVVKISWITHGIIKKRHIPTEVKDRGFFIAGTYYGVAAIVREVIRRYKDNDAIETTQQLLPGYERLQCSYALERNGSPCIIPINEFSAEELDAKADRLRANAEGLKLHAEEMDRYRESKFGPRESKNQQLTLIT